MAKMILILGGTGGAGLPTARLLLAETDAQLVLAGRNREKGERVAAELNAQFPGDRVTWRAADATDPAGLESAFAGMDLVVICSPNSPQAPAIARAALAAGADYLDIFFPTSVVDALRPLAPEIERAGRRFITQGGCHPGLVAPLVRFAATRIARPRRATVGMAIRTPYIGSVESVAELLADIRGYRMDIYRDGHWRAGGYKDARKIDLGPGFGVLPCYPMYLEELRPLPEELGLDELGLYAAGFNWFVDYVVFMLAYLFGSIRKGLGARMLARLMIWGMAKFSKPPFGMVFIARTEGERDGAPCAVEVSVRHADGYALTAIPVVACILQYLDGAIRPGLSLMGNAVEPTHLVRDIERMGVEVRVCE